MSFCYKVLFPTIWIGGFALGSIMLVCCFDNFRDHLNRKPPAILKLLFPVATVVGAAFLFWGCVPLKQVWIDDGALVISNFVRQARVPLADVAAVTHSKWINIRSVTVEFRCETAFGKSIIFMPKARFFESKDYPVVAEIRSAAQAASHGK
jgi:hypothetical protein